MARLLHTRWEDQKFFLVSKPDNSPGLALIFIFTEQLPAMVINAGLLSLIVCGVASTAGCANYSDSSQNHTALPAMLNQFTQTVHKHKRTHTRLHAAAATVVASN